MTDSQREVLRKPKAAEEIAGLHPLERGLLRTFEFLASIKLAVLLMLWLCIECTIGTLIESRVNTPAAQYFVYQTMRFYVLLSLLGLTILCAALIRFPWRLYQTGFVVTHTGLLLLLCGSLMTAKKNVDAQLSVPLGETESVYLNPDREQLVVRKHKEDGKLTSFPIVPVNFGPLTWGSKTLFGLYTWRENHTEQYAVSDDLTIRVKQFFANCTPEEIYVETDRGGVPAVQYRLHSDQGGADFSRWLAGDPRFGMIGEDKSLPLGKIYMWRVNSDAELEHFLHAVPKEYPKEFSESLGMLGYSHKGKHFNFSVDELAKKPVTVNVDGADITITLTEHLTNASPRRTETGGIEWSNNPAAQQNSMVKIKITAPDGEFSFVELMDHPEVSGLIQQKPSADHLLTYFSFIPTATVQMAITSQGRLGYRVFSSAGILACEEAELGKEYPCFGILKFTPLAVVGSGKPELRLRPKLMKQGEMGLQGIVAELDDGTNTKQVAMTRGAATRVSLGGTDYTIDYQIQQDKLPFAIRLNKFNEPTNPGTKQAAAYESEVTVIDESKSYEKDTKIFMNNPLYYTGSDGTDYTLYQSGIDRSTGRAISTFTVASDPGLETKYAGAIVLTTGIILMFYMGGYFKKSSGARMQSEVLRNSRSQPAREKMIAN